PRRRGSFGSGDGGLDVFYRRQHHLARDAARGRVVYRLLAIARAGHDGAINEISDIGVVGIGRRRGDGRVLILHGISLMIGWNETSIGSIPARNKPLLLDSLFNILDNGRLRGAWNETGQTRAIVVPHLLAGHTGHDGQLYRRGPSAGCQQRGGQSAHCRARTGFRGGAGAAQYPQRPPYRSWPRADRRHAP